MNAFYDSQTGGIRFEGLSNIHGVGVLKSDGAGFNPAGAISHGYFSVANDMEIGWLFLDGIEGGAFNAGEILPPGLSDQLSNYYIGVVSMGSGKDVTPIPIVTSTASYLPNFNPYAIPTPIESPPPVTDLPSSQPPFVDTPATAPPVDVVLPPIETPLVTPPDVAELPLEESPVAAKPDEVDIPWNGPVSFPEFNYIDQNWGGTLEYTFKPYEAVDSELAIGLGSSYGDYRLHFDVQSLMFRNHLVNDVDSAMPEVATLDPGDRILASGLADLDAAMLELRANAVRVASLQRLTTAASANAQGHAIPEPASAALLLAAPAVLLLLRCFTTRPTR